MSEQFDDASNLGEQDDASFVDSYGGDDISISQMGDDDEIGENDEEDSSMLAAKLKTGQNDYIVSVEKNV